MISKNDSDDINDKKEKKSFLIKSLNSIKNLFQRSNKK